MIVWTERGMLKMPGKAIVTFSETCQWCGTTVKVEGDSSLIGELLFCPICTMREFYEPEIHEVLVTRNLGIIR